MLNRTFRDTLKQFMSSYSECKEDASTVLIWEFGGFPLILQRNATFSKALNLRGYKTQFIICDGTSKACMQREIGHRQHITQWKSNCKQCVKGMMAIAYKYDIDVSMAGEYISTNTRKALQDVADSEPLENIQSYTSMGINVWRDALMSFIRYMQGELIEIDDLSNEQKLVYRKYFYACLVNTHIADQALRKIKPISLFGPHGYHVDYGPAYRLAVKKGIRSVFWQSGLFDYFHIFTALHNENEIVPYSIKKEKWDELGKSSMSTEESDRLDDFFDRRYFKGYARDLDISSKFKGIDSLRNELNIHNEKPIICVFTHLNWEITIATNQPYYNSNVWLIETIKKIVSINNVNWLIKIHPVESRGICSLSTGEIIERNFPYLPNHVKVLPADLDINPYEFFQLIDCGITLSGTIAMELPMLGKPVIVLGTVHYRKKGFTIEIDSKEKYFSLLKCMDGIPPLKEGQVRLARRYAYLYFIQRQIPINIIDRSQGHWGDLDLNKLNMLLPSNDPVMDMLCSHIIDGEVIMLNEEMMALEERKQKKVVIANKTESVSICRPDQRSKISPKDMQTQLVNVSPSKLLGFDPCGEVFEYNDRILRGIFKRAGQSCKKVFKICNKYDLFDHGIVKTDIVNDPSLATLGYDMILVHEKVPHITYAHEWPTEMIKDAALFQLDLNLKLNGLGVTLKDCGVTGNVLFNGTRPVFVDFLSLIFENELVKEEWLTPSVMRTPFQPLWSNKSGYFNEIFCRMFYPYMLFPLYMMHRRRFSETRRRMLQTTLNTCSEVITEKEAMANADLDLRGFQQRALAAREYALVHDDWARFLDILDDEVRRLNVSEDQSNYSGYYEQKGENFGFEPSGDWLPKQRAVYKALRELRPDSVLDIGANTGWFSILAAKSGCRVVAVDNDEASMNRLYKQSKREGLSILPLIMDILHPTPDVPPSPNLATDPHMINSRIKGDAFMLLSADKRLKCDMVLALAIIHHLTLGQGLGLREVVDLLSSFSHKHLVVEFVPKDDPLIVAEMDFFPAFNKNPLGFEWYSIDNWLQELNKHYKTIVSYDSKSARQLLICSI